MFRPRWKTLGFAAVLLTATQAVFAQVNPGAPSCQTSLQGVTVPPTVRAEGTAEFVGDLVLTCTGGAPTGAGYTVPTSNIELFLNTNITNRVDPVSQVSFTDALLVIDEPHSVANPNVPMLVCGAAGSNDNGSGQCPSVFGDGTGRNTYNGSSGHPNVFQGQLNGANAVLWPNVPLDFQGGSNILTLRFTNIRASISQLGGSSPNLVTAFISLSGAETVTVNNPQQTVAIWQNGLVAPATAPAAIAVCGSATTQSAAQFSATIQENFATAFRPKNFGQELANAPVGGVFGSGYPADQNQDIPGVVYNSESGFFDGASDPAPNALIPSIPMTADFPAIRNLNQTGVADQGTRVYVMLTNVPAGMTPYVPVTVALLSAESANLKQQTGVAVLTSTDSFGSGPFSPATGNAAGLAAMEGNGSSAMAVYEILYSSTTDRETITVPITASYAAGALTDISPSQLTGVQIGFAPFDTVSVPRFTATPDFTQTAFLYRPCSQADLTLGMTNSGLFSAGGTGTFSITVQNAGDTQTSGLVSVVDSLPQGLTATSMTGSGWNCTLTTLTCTRSDVLNAGSSYPSITLIANVAASAAGSSTNIATVSGGGETLTANDTASIVLNITPVQPVTVTTSTPGLTFIVDGITYGSPQVFQWATGSSHSLSVAAAQGLLGTEYVFSQWSDLGPATHNITVGSGAATYTASLGSPSQVILCTANTGVPPLVRAEGEAELVGDVVLFCTGGTPTSAGGGVPQIDLTITFNTAIFSGPQFTQTLTGSDNFTSRIPAAGYSEALLLIDEPHSGGPGSTNTLFPCGAAGSNDNGSGSCSITGNGTGVNTYDGSPGHPNVFQGQVLNASSIIWRNVPIDAAANSGFRILRFTNLRANASALPGGKMTIPPAVVETLSVTPGGLAIINSEQIVAYAQSSLITQSNGVATLSACDSANPSIAGNPNSPLDADGQNGAQFSITQTGGFASVFKVKNYAQLANAGMLTFPLYPADVNQDVPGYSYNTETGFFDGSPTEPLSYIPPTVEFPSIRGLNTVGQASSGTRVYFQFSPVPAGMQLYVPVSVPLVAVSGTPFRTGVALLTASDANGAGPFTPVAGNPAGLAAVPISNGVGLVVYEMLYANPNILESFTVPVAAAFLANQVTDTAINVQSGLAPLSTVTTADSISPLPRFASTAIPAMAFAVNSCADATPPFGSFDTPAATSNVSGSVGFTGWALSAAGITSVDIWREDSGSLVFVGDAEFVTGARADIQSAFPGYPGNASAGWGFQILTNELPSNTGSTAVGNGTYRIHAIAHDANGAGTDLGVKTIIADNADATQPFGTIDTPVQGGIASGTAFVNFGWALASLGKMIPVDGSTIWVFIDNVPVGHPVYNNYRSDIATLFPAYSNSQGAVGYFYIDTTQLTNGLHTISWSVTDDAGATSGIGSRYFTVQN